MRQLVFALSIALCARVLHAQDIVQVEHYVDTDPGYGEATQVDVTPGPDLDLAFTVDLSDETPGFHVLYVRAL